MTGSDTATNGHSGTGERAVPYCCPFCTEEDLRPVASGEVAGLARGGWHCRSCLRVFSLTFHGIHAPLTALITPTSAPATPTNSSERPSLESDRS